MNVCWNTRDSLLNKGTTVATRTVDAMHSDVQFKVKHLMINTVTGNFTIRDTTKSITLKGEFGGTIVDSYGNTKAGYELTGKINRKEFGLQWNGVTEAGGTVVSDDVRLHLNVQLLKVVAADEAVATA